MLGRNLDRQAGEVAVAPHARIVRRLAPGLWDSRGGGDGLCRRALDRWRRRARARSQTLLDLPFERAHLAAQALVHLAVFDEVTRGGELHATAHDLHVDERLVTGVLAADARLEPHLLGHVVL